MEKEGIHLPGKSLFWIIAVSIIGGLLSGGIAAFSIRKHKLCPPQIVHRHFDSIEQITAFYPLHDTLVIIERIDSIPYPAAWYERDSVKTFLYSGSTGSTCCWPIFENGQSKDTLYKTTHVYYDAKKDTYAW